MWGWLAAGDALAAENGAGAFAGFVVEIEVGGKAGSDAAEVRHPEHLGGVARGQVDGGGEWSAGEALQVVDGLVHGEHTAGQGAAGEADAVLELDGEVAEGVGAVGHAGGGHAVGDQDGAVLALYLEPEADEDGIDVDAVADGLGVEIVAVEDGADDAGLAVVEGAHG